LISILAFKIFLSTIFLTIFETRPGEFRPREYGDKTIFPGPFVLEREGNCAGVLVNIELGVNLYFCK